MAYPHTKQLVFPLKDYRVNARGFGVKVSGLGTHLGEDVLRGVDTPVMSIGRGRVVYSAFHPGSKSRGNWGHIIIIAHKNPRTRDVFYAVYGHLGKRSKQKGNRVEMGEQIGVVGAEHTRANGFWPSHLHFGIYVGPWRGVVLPGYYREKSERTQMKHWKEPSVFVKEYNK